MAPHEAKYLPLFRRQTDEYQHTSAVDVRLLEFKSYRLVSPSRYAPIWRDLSIGYALGWDEFRNRGNEDWPAEITCWPGRSRYNLSTGTHRRESHPERSEAYSLNLVEQKLAAEAGMGPQQFIEWAKRWRSYAAEIATLRGENAVPKALKQMGLKKKWEVRYVSGNWTALINQLARQKVAQMQKEQGVTQ